MSTMAESYTARPLSPVRKMIAARMADAARTIPHFRLAGDIELDALIALRPKLQVCEPEVRLSLNDLLVKACAAALIDAPAVNIQWAEHEIRQFHSADVAVVTAIEGGLSTPIIRRAETKTVWEISRELKELSARAARGSLKMHEILGGSFSISNLGMHGVDEFDAIINPPQCAILAIGRARQCQVVSVERQLRIVTVLRATLSVDHRALDGATAATFMAALRRRIEDPEHLLFEKREHP
jgi:pyruvate dehydrogenase E2 component (dihydrolipoamide acetyltransferase)